MKTKLAPRDQLFVDSEVQGEFLLRALVYWLIGVVSVGALFVVFRVPTDPHVWLSGDVWKNWTILAPVLLVSLLLVPAIAYDMARLSNRLAGPVSRLRDSLRRLSRGEQVAPLDFRQDDFWRSFAAEFNQLAARAAQTDENHVREIREAEPALAESKV